MISVLLTSQASTSSGVPIARAEADKTRHSSSELAAVDQPVAAFDSLLQVSRSTLSVHRGGGGASVSATQVFEPNVDDAHQRRQSTLKEDDRSGVGDKISRGPRDRTSVESRRGQRGEDATQSHVPSRDTQSRTGPERLARGQQAAGQTRSLQAKSDGQSSELPRKTGRFDHKTGGKRASRSVRSNSATARTSDSTYRSHQAAPSVATTSGVKAVGRAGGSGPTPAQQIAQTLGGPRGGESQAARAQSSSADQAHSSRSESSKSAAGEPSRSEQPANRAGKSADRAGGIERPAFDKLVRSLRLRIGTRNSSARMRLSPPELGRMNVEVKMVGTELQVEVRTQTEEARDLLTARAGELESALAKHGIHIDRFDVALERDAEGMASGNDPDRSGSDTAMSTQGDGAWHAFMATETGSDENETGDSLIPEVESILSAVTESRLDIRV